MSLYRKKSKKVAKIRIAGVDKPGIIATTTQYLFQNGCNIEDIDQRILEGYLIMNMLVDTSGVSNEKSFLSGLKEAAGRVGCDVEFKPEEKKRIKNVALLVTREEHCAQDLAENFKKGRLKGRPALMIGNYPDLKSLAQRYKIPFHSIPSEKKKEHETALIS